MQVAKHALKLAPHLACSSGGSSTAGWHQWLHMACNQGVNAGSWKAQHIFDQVAPGKDGREHKLGRKQHSGAARE